MLWERFSVGRVVTKILSCWVYAISKQGNEQWGSSFACIFFLLPMIKARKQFMKTRLQRTRECNKPVVNDLHFYIIIIIIKLYLISRGSVCMIFFIYFLVLLICFPTEYWSSWFRVGLVAAILHVKARSVENPEKTLKGANKSWQHYCKVLGYTVTVINLCLYPYTKCCCRFTTMSNKFLQGTLKKNNVLVIFADPTLKQNIGPLFANFNPYPSLSPVAKDESKQFQCIKHNQTIGFQ